MNRNGLWGIFTRIDADVHAVKTNAGFTLIELLISIAITVVITAALYFSLQAALDSWAYTKDQLALQMVLNDLNERIVYGLEGQHGLEDSMEIVSAGTARVEYVPPWTDATHTVASKDFVYTLNRKVKPGTGVPITEVEYPDEPGYKLIGAALNDVKESAVSEIRLTEIVPAGSRLKFSYHPDPVLNPDVIKYLWWDEEDLAVYTEYHDGLKELSDNPFGVRITGLTMRYFDNANNPVSESTWVDTDRIPIITGVELMLEARLGDYKRSFLSFISIRNAPMRSGYITLKDDMSIPIPDSKNIHTLLLTNIQGVDSEDVLEIEAVPERGRSWLLKIVFGRVGFAAPTIARCTVEYPPGNEVFWTYPKTSVDIGLDMLLLDPSGKYDYDDDEDVDDDLILEGDVVLTVRAMDVKGAGLFVRP